MRTKAVCALACAGALCATPIGAVSDAHGASARAASACSMGRSHISYNQLGEAAVFKRLRAMQGMNCASARYVMNSWLRRTYEQSYSHRLPTHFYDGYVTWYCGKYTRKKWRCDEYDSNTAFRFVAYRL
jgi:hypothetical protein